ncbi:hypothetical protein [Pseudomonas sp. TCU-HL1]|uniref:hypothetical protein n=1 Tax=Pseudomonas sp. TCU-HL1 TaxID=1856685 RepID=UPI00083D9203|nr:hypothetical protein [Pseudomonas sp. TCU-HL1]AOE84568.1 hypothetical protein THL1_2020 [Pseudomonas sp. TCU-HL1]
MHQFLVDRGNLRVSAQYLIDKKRVLDDMDLEVVEELIRARLREIYGPHETSGVFVYDAVSVWGPLFCLPYQSPDLDEADIVLNLFFKAPSAVFADYDFEVL